MEDFALSKSLLPHRDVTECGRSASVHGNLGLALTKHSDGEGGGGGKGSVMPWHVCISV